MTTDALQQDDSEDAEVVNILDRIELKTKAKKPRKQRSEAPAPLAPPGANEYFKPLGYDHGKYYFLSGKSKQIVELSAGKLAKAAELLALAPLQWWEREFAGDSGLTGKSLLSAANYLIQSCHAAGVFSDEKRRGRGVWPDLDDIVIHAGDRLFVNGDETSLVSAQTEMTYECATRIDVDINNKLAAEDAKLIARWATSLNFESKTDAVLLMGWLTVAIASGALNWRPHIFISGEKGSGKSSVLRVLIHLLHGFVLSVTGSTSAAGIRQTLKHDAMPVVFDEAEGDSQKALANIEDVLALMRHASANVQAKVLKGGADGKASSSTVRSCFCLTAIRDPVHQAADISRISVLNLSQATNLSRHRNDTVTTPLADEILSGDFAERFRGRVLSRIPEMLETIQVFTKQAQAMFQDSRMGDQIGALIGGAWMLTSDEIPTAERALASLKTLDFGAQQEIIEGASDQEACLSAIMEAKIHVDGKSWRGDATVGELVQYIQSEHTTDAPGGIAVDTAKRALALYGLKVDDTDRTRLLISNSNTMLASHIMAKTTWSRGWGKLLARLPQATKPERVVKIGGYVSRCVSVVISMP